MDWEKKTTKRDDLQEAAADAFNDLQTPGQQLLTALQNAEVVRKDKYFNTIDAKMKSARERLPALHARNPVRSDISIFRPGDVEVHALLPDILPTQVSSAVGATR